MSRAFSLVLSLALGLAGCRTLDGPGLVPVPEETARVSGWLAREREAAEQRHGVRGFGKLIFETPRGTLRARQVVIAQYPNRLRLESQNLLGQTQSLLVLDGEQFSFYDGTGFEQGAVSETLLLEALGLDLAPDEAVSLLLARLPLPEGVPAVFASGEGRVAHFENARIAFSGDGEVERFERLRCDGSVRWSAEFAGWRDLGNGRYPFAMQLDFPASELRARLELQDGTLNPTLPESLFRLESPSHSTH